MSINLYDFRPQNKTDGIGQASTLLILNQRIDSNEYAALQLLAHRLHKELFPRSRTESVSVISSSDQTVIALRYFRHKHPLGFYDKASKLASKYYDQLSRYL